MRGALALTWVAAGAPSGSRPPLLLDTAALERTEGHPLGLVREGDISWCRSGEERRLQKVEGESEKLAERAAALLACAASVGGGGIGLAPLCCSATGGTPLAAPSVAHPLATVSEDEAGGPHGTLAATALARAPPAAAELAPQYAVFEGLDEAPAATRYDRAPSSSVASKGGSVTGEEQAEEGPEIAGRWKDRIEGSSSSSAPGSLACREALSWSWLAMGLAACEVEASARTSRPAQSAFDATNAVRSGGAAAFARLPMGPIALAQATTALASVVAAAMAAAIGIEA